MPQNAGPLEALVLEIQRMSTEDGPGLRTTVFFKGCPLRCAWCHNPESISTKPQVQWIGSKCIGCKSCLAVCSTGALTECETGIVIDRDLCEGCGTCATECPSTALELMGHKWTLDDLVEEVAKDKAFFEKSSGGVTLGGGEPSMQGAFAVKFLKRLKDLGISTALDTCGLCAPEQLDKLLPYADLVLFDLKLIDTKKHKLLAGSPNDKILANLRRVGESIKNKRQPSELWIRTPIIPGATDDEENIRGIGRFLAENMRGFVTRWELCAFNNLCRDKYLRLGVDWKWADADLLRSRDMEKLYETAKDSGVNPDIVVWTGSTQMENNSGDHPKSPKPKVVKNCASC